MEEHKEAKFYKSWRTLFSTTHHTDIGILYIWFAFANFVAAGLAASTMRLQLGAFGPDAQLIPPQLYYSLVTLHGLAMVFFFIVPASVGIANYILPKMIGAPDLYWPKINALAFWMLVPSAILFWSSLLFGYPDITWTLYPPWSVMNKDLAVDVLLIGVLLNGISSVISAINFMMTVFRLRHPSIKISRLPLFVWAFVATIILLIVALPPFALGIVMLLFDRHWGTNFFVGQGDPLLWQNIFWFMGHPEVYILVLPAMGMVSEIIPRMAGRPIFGYKSIAMSSFLIAFISYFVWVHHMFTTPVGTTVTVFFMVSTLAVAVPTGIKVFNWVATLWGGRIRVCTPMVFALGFVSIFIIGGITGVVQGLIPLDYDVHNTYFILGHFHLIVLPIAFAIIGTIYYFFPFITGRMFSEKLSKVAFILMFVGVLGTYLPWLKVGLEGMPRRYYEYPPEYYFWQNISTMFTVVLGIGLLIFFIDVLYSWRRGKPAKEDPWGATKIGLPEFANVTPLLNLNGSAHEAHYPHPYAAFAGILSILAGIGSLLMLEGYLYLGGYILALYAGYLLFWFYKDYISKSSKLATFLSSISLEKLERLKSSDAFIGTMWFVLSESAIFGTAFLSYFYLRAMFPTWPPPGVTPVATSYVLINSIFLFASAFTMQFAYWGLTKGNMKRFKILLIVTLILGSIFIGGQIREYLTSGLSISDGVYGGTFYLITGLHGFHVIVGLVFMAVILARALKGYFTPERKAMVESATIYWHFVDIVWIFVLSIVYFNLISPPLREVAHTYIWQS